MFGGPNARSYRAAISALAAAFALSGCLIDKAPSAAANAPPGSAAPSSATNPANSVVSGPSGPATPTTPSAPTSPSAPTAPTGVAPQPAIVGTPQTPPFAAGPTVSAAGVITTVRVSDTASAPLANRVVTFGQPFAAGHVPGGVVASLDGRAVPTQIDVKRRHADGSVRHAIISVGIPANASASTARLELRQAASMPASGAARDLDTLLAGGFDVVLEVIEGGVTYRTSARQQLQSGATKWLDGGIVSELRSGGPLRAGGSAHPVFEGYFDVRFFGATSARVSVTLENTLANEARGERRAAIRILDQRGQVLFAQPEVYVPAHSRTRKVFDWGESMQTKLAVAPELAYVVGTGAVPRYDTTKTLDPRAVTDMVNLQAAGLNEVYGNGPITSYMPQTGGRADIGVLPQWTVVALYTGDARAQNVMYAAGEFAGSYQIHLRDPLTRKPYSIERNPNVSTHWNAPASLPSCANRCTQKDTLATTDPAIVRRVHQADAAHQPSLAFVPYLLSGDPYYLDEMYFWTVANFLAMHPQHRGFAAGILGTDGQTRGQAWAMRTLAQTAWIAPDEHAEEKNFYESRLAANLTWYRQNAMPGNTWAVLEEGLNFAELGGRPQPELAANVYSYYAPWQLDFFSTVFTYIHGMGYADAQPLRDWMVRGLVARLTTPAEFNPFDAVAYQIAYRVVPAGCDPIDPRRTPGMCSSPMPAFATLGDIWRASFARRATGTPTAFASPTCTLCYEAVGRAALAGAVRAGVSKASEAHALLDGEMRAAAGRLASDPFLRDPTWLIVP